MAVSWKSLRVGQRYWIKPDAEYKIAGTFEVEVLELWPDREYVGVLRLPDGPRALRTRYWVETALQRKRPGGEPPAPEPTDLFAEPEPVEAAS